jgi:ribulose-bisphosphate carboxylase large chain
MSAGRVTATYRIETAHPLDKAVALMAGEMAAGTFVKVAGETPELLENHGGSIESLTDLGPVDAPALPGAKPPKHSAPPYTYRRAEVVLSFPFENVGHNLPVLISTLAGNVYELGPFSGVRLLDFDLPPAFADAYPGPQFGVEGTRRLTGVYDRPVIGTIIKPSVGLKPHETADVVRQLVGAGVDFIKDDEKIASPPYSPFAERVQAVMRVINDHADKTGQRVMFAFNISGDVDDMLRQHDLVVQHGGVCVMVNMISVGAAGVNHLRRHSQLAIHGHRCGWGMYSREPGLGMDYTAFQKFFRLAGVDHFHVNGIRNKFCESDESVIASARAVLAPFLGGKPAMPVFASGQWAGMAPDTYAALGSSDALFVAGGGTMGHPDGPAAGVVSIREAWEAAAQGIALEAYARDHRALRLALETFGTP